MDLMAAIKGRGASGFGYRSTAREVLQGVDLRGKTFLLTGCNSGLGRETLRELTRAGARLIATARTEEKARSALQEVAAPGAIARSLPLACELADPDSVQACVRSVQADGAALDGIICNAGIMALPDLNQAHGYELQFFTNHIGHFILVTGLLDQLADQARVVMLSSAAHLHPPRAGIDFGNLSGERGYFGWLAYGQSKLANLLFAKELARRLQGTGKTANAVHPGVIRTNLARHAHPVVQASMKLGDPFLKTPQQGAATQCYVAAHPSAGTASGEYFADCNLAKPSRKARDAGLAAQLWTESEAIVRKVTAGAR